MTRISTAGSYNNILSNILAAQERQNVAGQRTSTQKNGSDLKGYARNAEVLTAMKSIDGRLDHYTEQNKIVGFKLETQNLALIQVSDAADSARKAISEALANNRADGLMSSLQTFVKSAAGGLNTKFDGKYLFAGAVADTAPLSAKELSDLSGGTTASFFQNDTYIAQAKIDDNTTLTTGQLADDIGTDLVSAFKSIQDFNGTAAGPFAGTLTDTQRIFLENQLATWSSVSKNLVNSVAKNGSAQAQLDTTNAAITNQQTSVKTMLGDITDANMAEAATQLSQAQIAVQAASQTFISLQNSSLLNFLK